MNKTRHLTKKLFTTALQCPTKMYYAANSEYADQSKEDAFLQSLAEGGYQVNELAHIYFSGGTFIKTLNKKEALRITNKLLRYNEVSIYEPAFEVDNFFIRTDIFIKNDSDIEIIEIKSKSFRGEDAQAFYNKKGDKLSSEWLPYLYDVAFQKFVTAKKFPKANIKSFLLLPDKNKTASVDGLNRLFPLTTDKTGAKIVEGIENIRREDVGDELLSKVDVTDIVEKILTDELGYDLPMPFEDYAYYLAEKHIKNEKITKKIYTGCATCSFKTKTEDSEQRSGFDECWASAYEDSGYTKEDDTVLSLWNFRGKQKLMDKGIYFLNDISWYDIFDDKDKADGANNGMSTKQRQWLQILKSISKDARPYFKKESLKKQLDSVTYPLHFIDFETTMAAIPFYKGMHPYEGIAFQFSHHMLHEDGKVEHAGQFLSSEPGKFPNFDFVRALKQQLETDNGTVFCYSQHENNFLNILFEQIYAADDAPEDKQELLDFIKSITHSSPKASEQWKGERDMFDMLELIKKYYYNPHTKGSNSIKYVLPAVLNSSEYLQTKYSQPIYGSENLLSLNFKNQVWIQKDGDEVKNPYKLLPEFKLETSSIGKIEEGGSAMSAFGILQFETISDTDRKTIENALLQYCELDTFSMVVIWEYFLSLVMNDEL